MAENKVCPFCFAAVEQEYENCPECGNGAEAQNPQDLLSVGTLLNDRFLMGKVIHRNDLLTAYLAWDTAKERKVQVEEFFPGILKRAENGRDTLLLSEQSRTEFRTMVSDLHDRWKRLIPVNHRALLKTIMLFSENGTIYRVSEYLRMTSLAEYLPGVGHPLDPVDAKLLISPVISLLSQLHNMGLTHCGISPENIWVDSRKRVVLTGFALPELRTVGGGLQPELYEGYSAPEQYSKALWQGEWTDIYSSGAVLYYLFTGVTPVSAQLRSDKDTLKPLRALRPDLPEYLSDAVMHAMEPDKKYRFKSMEQFSIALLEESGANTAVFRPEEAGAAPAAKKTLLERPAVKWIAAGVLILSLAANIYFAVLHWGSSEPQAPVTPAVQTVERDFSGYYLEAIRGKLDTMENYRFSYRYEYNSDYPEGVIYKQSLSVGQVLPEDGSITLYISKGLEYTSMPDLLGANENYAMRILSDLQIQYTIEYDTNPETGGEVGTVVETSIDVGEQVRPKSAVNPDTVILTVKKENLY